MRIWRDELPREASAILTTPEPLEAELEVEEETLAYWLYRLGIQVYRIRASGHYYPHELRNLLGMIRPKKLVPIHTRNPSLLMKLVSTI